MTPLLLSLVALLAAQPTYEERLYTAKALVEQEGPERALGEAEALVGSAPDRPEGLLLLGTLYRRLWRPLEAVETFSRALPLDRRLAVELHRETAVTYAELQAWEKALEHLDSSLALRPGYPPSLYAKAMVLSQTGRKEDALRLYQGLGDESAANPALHFRIAEIYDSENRTEVAEAGYRRALALDDTMQPAHFRLGKLLLSSGRTREAERELARAVELAPRHAESHLELAQALDILERPDRARHHFEQAMELNPSLATAYLGYGNFTMRHGDRERASKLLAMFQALKADEERARDHLEAIDHAPSDLAARTELIEYLIDRGHFPLALRSAQRFLLSEPEVVKFHVLVARVYYAWERRGEALRTLAAAEARFRESQTALQELESARERMQR